jgi:hypothetical protein
VGAAYSGGTGTGTIEDLSGSAEYDATGDAFAPAPSITTTGADRMLVFGSGNFGTSPNGVTGAASNYRGSNGGATLADAAFPTASATGTTRLNNVGTDSFALIHSALIADTGASSDPTPTFVGAGTIAWTATSGATFTPGLPSGWVADDIHVLFAHLSNNGALNTTPLSGWTKLSPSGAAENNTTAQHVEVWWRRAVAGDTAPGLTLASNSVTIVRGAIILGIRGCPTSGDPFSASSRSNNGTPAANIVTFATLTPPDANTRLLALYAYEDDPSAASTMSGWGGFTVPSPSSLGTDAAIGYATRAWPTANSATGALTTTVSGGTYGNTSPNVGVLLSFKPAATAPTGTGGITISKPSVGGSGDVLNPITGTGGIAIGAPSLGGSGDVTVPPATGTGGIVISVPTLGGTGDAAGPPTGTGGLAISKPSFAGAGEVSLTGSGGIAISRPTLGGTGTVISTGTGGIVISRPSFTGAGAVISTGSGGLVISKPSFTGAGAVIVSGSGGIVIGRPALGATGAVSPPPVSGSGGITVNVPSLGGIGTVTATGTGGIAISRPSLGGTGTAVDPGSGSGGILIGPPSFAGAGGFTPPSPASGSGGLIISRPSLGGAGIVQVLGSGGIVIGPPALGATGFSAPPGAAGSGGIVISRPTIYGYYTAPGGGSSNSRQRRRLSLGLGVGL